VVLPTPGAPIKLTHTVSILVVVTCPCVHAGASVYFSTFIVIAHARQPLPPDPALSHRGVAF
jgi:hypothetical protein